MSQTRKALGARCRDCWIGGCVLVLGGGSLAFSGFSGLDSAAILTRFGIAVLIGAVLSWIFCPAPRRRSGDGGPASDGSDGCADHGAADDSGTGGDSGGGDGGGE